MKFLITYGKDRRPETFKRIKLCSWSKKKIIMRVMLTMKPWLMKTNKNLKFKMVQNIQTRSTPKITVNHKYRSQKTRLTKTVKFKSD